MACRKFSESDRGARRLPGAEKNGSGRMRGQVENAESGCTAKENLIFQGRAATGAARLQPPRMKGKRLFFLKITLPI
jgi:hypothetical protein